MLSKALLIFLYVYIFSVAYQGGFKPLHEILKALQNHAKLNLIVKTVKIAEFRSPSSQDVQKKSSKILKLPLVRVLFYISNDI